MKYGLQAKIGRMDGVIVAYHNTAEIFGFQYIPLEDMERCIYGESLSFTSPTGVIKRGLEKGWKIPELNGGFVRKIDDKSLINLIK